MAGRAEARVIDAMLKACVGTTLDPTKEELRKLLHAALAAMEQAPEPSNEDLARLASQHNAWGIGSTRHNAIAFARAALKLPRAAGTPSQPVAWVPVHPQHGALWANTTADPSPERLPSYPLRGVVWADAPEAVEQPPEPTGGDAADKAPTCARCQDTGMELARVGRAPCKLCSASARSQARQP